jgi:hypothetical protein
MFTEKGMFTAPVNYGLGVNIVVSLGDVSQCPVLPQLHSFRPCAHVTRSMAAKNGLPF